MSTTESPLKRQFRMRPGGSFKAAGAARAACYGAGMKIEPVLCLALVLSLAACAGAPGQYPSLAIRDVERVHGSAEPAEPPLVPPPVVPSPELAGHLAELYTDAARAHQAFMTELPRTRELVAGATSAQVASDPWVEAQTRIGGLEVRRSKVMLVAADLDAMLLAVELEGGAREAIAQTQEAVDAMVREEDAALAGLVVQLRS